MGTFLLALVVVVCLMAAMAVGVIFGRKPIAGTCGGLNNMGAGGECEICGGNPKKCDEAGQVEVSDLAYDASRNSGRN